MGVLLPDVLWTFNGTCINSSGNPNIDISSSLAGTVYSSTLTWIFVYFLVNMLKKCVHAEHNIPPTCYVFYSYFWGKNDL